MPRPVVLAAAVLVVALLCPPAAVAKGGPTGAAVAGPGLAAPIVLRAHDGSALRSLVTATAFVEASFGYGPQTHALLAERPRGRLGPRYAIDYSIPGPDETEHRIRQHLYPYASPRPVAYVPWGQRVFDTQRTTGGWFVAATLLRETLVELGLPGDPPGSGVDAGNRSRPTRRLAAPAAVVGALAVLGCTLLVRHRTRGVVRPEP